MLGLYTTAPESKIGCGDRTRTCDLRVMSPTSCQLLHPATTWMSECRRCGMDAAVLVDLPLKKWWRMTGSNRRPSACKADALPAELILHDGDAYGIRTRECRLERAMS